MSEDTLYNHSQLGPIKAVRLPEGGLQFRNLLYATIPERWRHSIVVDESKPHTIDDSPYDATKWGPMCPQPDNTIDFDFGLIQKKLPVDHEIFLDEWKCLNLALTTPKVEEGQGLLPVVVFIHGGGFFLGGNAWPQYDTRQLVRLAASIGKPVIGIGINYRLGLLGGLASTELTGADAGNFGLTDQANALCWIQKYVAGFGGDPNNVTIMGESAGAISVWMHFLRGEPIFTRGVSMSGDPRLRRPQKLEKAEECYRSLLKELDVENLSVGDRVSFLRSVPWRRLIASPLNMRCYPTLTGGFQDISWDKETGVEQIRSQLTWCKTLVVGDCELDATAMVPTIRHDNWYSQLKGILDEELTPDEVIEIINTYKLDKNLKSPTGVHPGLVEFVTDVRFYMPVVIEGRLAEEGLNVHIYHFHEPNPFEGPFRGRAGHVLDIAYTLQTYQEFLPPESQIVSSNMGIYIIDVSYGLLDSAQGRPLYSNEDGLGKQVLVWDDQHKQQVISANTYDVRFRKGVGRLLENIGIEKCSRCLDIYQGWTV